MFEVPHPASTTVARATLAIRATLAAGATLAVRATLEPGSVRVFDLIRTHLGARILGFQ